MVFADEVVGALLALGGKVAVSQVVTAQDLIAANVGGVKDRKMQTREAASYGDFVRGRSGGLSLIS